MSQQFVEGNQAVTPSLERADGQLEVEPFAEPFSRIPTALVDHWRKHGGWSPDRIDLEQDRRDYAALSPAQQNVLRYVTGQFLIGEVNVAKELAPIIRVMQEEERTGDLEYLDTFVEDEAKHIAAFQRFFEIVVHPECGTDRYRLPHFGYVFDEALPSHLTALNHDRSPAAQARAMSTFSLVCEGVAAETAYEAAARALNPIHKMPGLLEMVSMVMRDESRHIAYGCHVLSRLVHEHPLQALPALGRTLTHFRGPVRGIVGEINALETPFPFELEDNNVEGFALGRLGARVRMITGGQFHSLSALEKLLIS